MTEPFDRRTWEAEHLGGEEEFDCGSCGETVKGSPVHLTGGQYGGSDPATPFVICEGCAGEATERHEKTGKWKIPTRDVSLEMFTGKLSPARAIEHRDGLVGVIRHFPKEIAKLAVWEGCPPERAALLVSRVVAGGLENADLLLWSDAMWAAAHRGSEVFEGREVPDDCWGISSQFWMTETAMPDLDEEEFIRRLSLPGPCSQAGWLVSRSVGTREMTPEIVQDNWIPADKITRFGISLCAILTPYLEQRPLPILRWMPFFGAGERVEGFTARLVAAIEFLQLPFVSVERRNTISRAHRRWMERKGHHVPELRVVVLRKAAERERERESEEVDWSCHWMVKGHWRNQWCPGKKEHKPVYVSPYLKGDFSQPFKPPSPTVYAVKR